MLLILHFGERVSCGSEWPQISYVAEDGFEPTTLWHPLPECWYCRCFKWKSFITEAVTFLQPSKPKHPSSEVFCGCGVDVPNATDLILRPACLLKQKISLNSIPGVFSSPSSLLKKRKKQRQLSNSKLQQPTLI